jgi:cell division protein FtsI (penicillin-binding protein 3)
MQSFNKTKKIAIIFLVFLFGFLTFFIAIFVNIASSDMEQALVTRDEDKAIRGSILSSDGFTISASKKLYKASVNPFCIRDDKKELFVKLFSIYSQIPEEELYKKLDSATNHNLVLSYNINQKYANYLKDLSKKLNLLNVFQEIEYKGRAIKQGLSIIESGEDRVATYNRALTPIVGHTVKYEDKHFTRRKGVTGVEGFYDKELKSAVNGQIVGKRDVNGYIVLSKNSITTRRVDGYNLHLNISLKIQSALEALIDSYQEKLGSKEILASIVESNTGKVLALASTKRFNPNNITPQEAQNLTTSAVSYIFEPGSVIKPLTFAFLLENNKMRLDETIRGYNGFYKLGNKTIQDEHRFNFLSADEVIIHSSNIGIAQLAKRLSGLEYYKWLKRVGIDKPTGIDMLHEQYGSFPSVKELNNDVYKATVGYGYGINISFAQLLKIYNIFNNNGSNATLRIGDFLSNEEGKELFIETPAAKQVFSQETTKLIKSLLIEVVNKGTGKGARYKGLEIGGKTGTARIARAGEYDQSYNNSFFGFANDISKKYTIGVTVIEPDQEYGYASRSAVPIFRDMVDLLVKHRYLLVNEE